MDPIIEIDVMRCWRAVCRKALALLLVFVLGLPAGFGVHRALFEQENEYAACTEVLVSELYIVPTCAEVAKTETVLQRAAGRLDGAYSADRISSLLQVNYRENVIANIPVVQICISSRDAEEAAAIAQAVTEAYVEVLHALMGPEVAYRLSTSASVTVLYNAGRTCLLVTLGTACLLAALAVAVIVLREILALRLTTVKDGVLGGQLKLLGVIPRYKE